MKNRFSFLVKKTLLYRQCTRWVTIDPGISGTGWAYFEQKKLIKWGNTYAPKSFNFQQKTARIVSHLKSMDSGVDLTVFCEWPTGRFSGKKGLAASNTDAILKLTYFIGYLSAKFKGVTLIPVQKWKGQLSKDITRERAEVFFQKKGFKSHAADAVGIGQYVIEEGLI